MSTPGGPTESTRRSHSLTGEEKPILRNISYSSSSFIPRKRRSFFLAVISILLIFFFISFTFTFPHIDNGISSPAPIFPASLHTVSPPLSTVTHTVTVHQNLTVYRNVTTPPEPVVFALVMFSTDSAREGAILLKSILMYSGSPSDFHIICDDAAHQYLQDRFSLVTRPLHSVRVFFYLLSNQDIISRIQREGSIASDHSAGYPGLMKLFIHEILPDTVKKAIFLDTDAFFISDPTLLWNVFDGFKPETAISMPTHEEQHAPEWNFASKICSCVMLLNLEKLRTRRLMDSNIYRDNPSPLYPPALSPPAFAAMYGPPGASGHYEGVYLGDQGYWWAIVKHSPDIFEHLSYEWEVSSCLLDMYMTGLGHDGATEAEEASSHIHTWNTPHQGEAILPKFLHFNCLHGSDQYYEWEGWSDPANTLNQRWGAAVAYHVGFKWLWLNKGDHRNSQTALEMTVIPRVIFADEIFAADSHDQTSMLASDSL